MRATYRVERSFRMEKYLCPDFFCDKDKFLLLKANVCDLNKAYVYRCIEGSETDFIDLMKRAESFLDSRFPGISEKKVLLERLKECIFGFYILTPLISERSVTDIKVLSFDRIVIKKEGKRYLTDLSFLDEADYRDWLLRILKVNRVKADKNLIYFSDLKSSKDFYLRIDVQSPSVTSSQIPNVHIRKMPKEKLSWEYLFNAGMLDRKTYLYIKDRIDKGYGFLISGKGGSGKSTLLNVMIDLVPFSESVLVLQESDELYSNVHPQMQFEHTIEGKVSLEDELRLGLLQDIDNFVIGEIKGGEALYVFTTALSTGARFLGTIHSNDAASSVIRLAQCARYISDYSVESLVRMLSSIPFVLIHMKSFSITEILEIKGFDEKSKSLSFDQIFRKEGLCS